MLSLLKKEEAVYENNKHTLIRKGEGKYVVVKGDVILSFFNSEEAALKEGYKKFKPSEPFLVRKVSLAENLHYFSFSL